jgi:lipoprotein signal peptidase
MKIYLIVNATLLLIGALGNLFDLTRRDAVRPTSDRTRALAVVLQGVLCAWAVLLLMQGRA